MEGMDSWQIQLKGLGKKEGGDVFEDGGGGGGGGDTLMHTMNLAITLNMILIY